MISFNIAGFDHSTIPSRILGILCLIFFTACKTHPGEPSDPMHDWGKITADERAPWLWLAVGDEEAKKLLPPLQDGSEPDLLPQEQPLAKRLDAWLAAIHRHLSGRYPKRFQGVQQPRVAVYRSQGNTMAGNAYVSAFPICAKNFRLVRDFKGYQGAREKSATNSTVASILGVKFDASSSVCALPRVFSPEEVDSRLALFNQRAATKGGCHLVRDGELIALLDRRGLPCPDKNLDSTMGSVGQSMTVAFGIMANRVFVASDLVSKLSELELVGIISHELGHYYAAHMLIPDPDFGRFIAADTLKQRKPSRPTIPRSDSGTPLEQQIIAMEKDYQEWQAESDRAFATGFGTLAAKDLATQALNRQNISAYDYPHVKGPFPLELSRLMINGIVNMPTFLPEQKSRQQESCDALFQKYVSERTPIHRFLTEEKHDQRLLEEASTAVGALWGEAKSCLDFDVSSFPKEAFFLVAYALLDWQSYAWEGTSDITSDAAKVLSRNEAEDVRVSPEKTKNIFDYYRLTAAKWVSGDIGRRTRKIDPLALSKPLATLINDQDKASVAAILAQDILGKSPQQVFLQRNREIWLIWKTLTKGHAVNRRIVEMVKNKHLAIYTAEDQADQLAVEILAAIGVSPTNLQQALYKISFGITPNTFTESQDQCRALQRSGWPTPPAWGLPSDDHAAGCYRIFDIDAEMLAHRAQMGQGAREPAVAISGVLSPAEWSHSLDAWQAATGQERKAAFFPATAIQKWKNLGLGAGLFRGVGRPLDGG